jgi:hypothetical protein
MNNRILKSLKRLMASPVARTAIPQLYRAHPAAVLSIAPWYRFGERRAAPPGLQRRPRLSGGG